MYIISSCLVGINCRYNATSTLDLELKKLIDEGKAIALCPELLAGLPTPRPPCEIQIESGVTVVKSKAGEDFTDMFKKAGEETLKVCKNKNINKAILQSRSPSCGYGKIYDGSFEGNLIKGNGLTADLLSKNGIEIFTDENWSNQQE